MYLDDIVAAQKSGEARGIASICSAHPWVLRAAMEASSDALLIEATCNQVNQFGGYTSMRPEDFVSYLRGIANQNNFPPARLILGGDHLGPSPWQAEPANTAMDKSLTLVQQFVQAGFTKIHLDCSMRLADDPPGGLDIEISALRTAQLVRIAEASASDPQQLRYVIGTEVPVPGGAQTSDVSIRHEDTVRPTSVESVTQTITVTRHAFLRQRLEAAWERIIAVVVQPGVEFGDDFILPYQRHNAQALSRFIETQSMVYEAHSTDYQTPDALVNLVHDHFAILKVGPALTFAFREAVFALAMIENELYPPGERSSIIAVLDDVMQGHPEHWINYYPGNQAQQAFKRKYSFSDRIRYYWTNPRVEQALERLQVNLTQTPLSWGLVKQFAPDIAPRLNNRQQAIHPEQVFLVKIKRVLEDYFQAFK